ncbi:hypothetical protein BT96DRAFT_983780 [Gymnopus androsaceus JB14]|uniref:Uncharacterized protein n=1 Tax=Gymnopus androsaceus JB14 TaxID=1447944 RepID=A0A6A4IMD6_9AGAR|nr:hypothetical protein BT96DRAFT_983780 [Gymnopus androsaceus JB14]
MNGTTSFSAPSWSSDNLHMTLRKIKDQTILHMQLIRVSLSLVVHRRLHLSSKRCRSTILGTLVKGLMNLLPYGEDGDKEEVDPDFQLNKRRMSLAGLYDFRGKYLSLKKLEPATTIMTPVPLIIELSFREASHPAVSPFSPSPLPTRHSSPTSRSSISILLADIKEELFCAALNFERGFQIVAYSRRAAQLPLIPLRTNAGLEAFGANVDTPRSLLSMVPVCNWRFGRNCFSELTKSESQVMTLRGPRAVLPAQFYRANVIVKTSIKWP